MAIPRRATLPFNRKQAIAAYRRKLNEVGKTGIPKTSSLSARTSNILNRLNELTHHLTKIGEKKTNQLKLRLKTAREKRLFPDRNDKEVLQTVREVKTIISLNQAAIEELKETRRQEKGSSVVIDEKLKQLQNSNNQLKKQAIAFNQMVRKKRQIDRIMDKSGLTDQLRRMQAGSN